MKNNKFFYEYYNNLTKLLFYKSQENTFKDLDQVSKKILATKKKNKVIIIGNGGSAAIASHFAIDLCKNTSLISQCFNDSSLITCLANDYGYENWTKKAIDFYGEKGDVLLAISSSGNSKNILNACKEAKKKKFSSIITFSGFSGDNKLRKMGNINMWVDSSVYNIVENIHQIWLLSAIDFIKEHYES